jgi:hypothetical protein
VERQDREEETLEVPDDQGGEYNDGARPWRDPIWIESTPVEHERAQEFLSEHGWAYPSKEAYRAKKARMEAAINAKMDAMDDAHGLCQELLVLLLEFWEIFAERHMRILIFARPVYFLQI